MVLFTANVSSQSYTREEIEGNLALFCLFAKEKKEDIESVLNNKKIKYKENLPESISSRGSFNFDWYKYASITIFTSFSRGFSTKSDGYLGILPKNKYWFNEFIKYIRNNYTKYGYHPNEEYYEMEELESYIDFIYTDGIITHAYLSKGDEFFRKIVSKRKLR